MTQDDLDRKARELLERTGASISTPDEIGSWVDVVRLDDTLRAITAALRLAAPEWRPIETAPTDETLVMGYFGEDESMRGFSAVARFFKWECMPKRLPSGWPSQRCMPTHWAPLPAAPTLADEGDNA